MLKRSLLARTMELLYRLLNEPSLLDAMGTANELQMRELLAEYMQNRTQR